MWTSFHGYRLSHARAGAGDSERNLILKAMRDRKAPPWVTTGQEGGSGTEELPCAHEALYFDGASHDGVCAVVD